MLSLLGVLVALATSAAARATVYSEGHGLLSVPTDRVGEPGRLPACLADAYYGAYGAAGEALFIPAPACALEVAERPSFNAGRPVRPLPHLDGANYRLVWVGPAGVEGQDTTDPAAHLRAWRSMEHNVAVMRKRSEQLVFGAPHGAGAGGRAGSAAADTAAAYADRPVPELLAELVGMTHHGFFLAVTHASLPVLDTYLPAHYVAVGVPDEPVALAPKGPWDIPRHYADHLADVTKALRFNSKLAKITNSLSADAVRKDVRWLTGEDSDIISRHSFTAGARQAAAWIKDKVAATGASCEYFDFLSGFSPNVICTYPSRTESDKRVILSAHYDSRGSLGNMRAPGGDDDGSGTGHVLAVADAIQRHNVTFDRPLTLAFFAGEEQGLWGSHYYAKHLASAKVNATVIFQLQADMLAYHAPGEPLQLGLPATIELPEAGWLVANVSLLYAPELVVGRTAACCSDHQSFVKYGFPATQVFERNGGIADPMYHNSGDVSDRPGYDFDQLVSIAKVTLASVFEVAGYHVN